MSNISVISWREQVTLDVMMVNPLCTRPTVLVVFYRDISLQQRPYVARIRHITMIPRQPIFVLTPF